MPPTFDALAPTYDQDFTASPIARELRARVHTRLDKHFAAGQHILEMGCGTGEDALHLAQRGVRVTATDASPAMLEAARAKIKKNHEPPRRQEESLIQFTLLDLNNLPTEFPAFDGVFANFGVINCLADWRALAGWLVKRLPAGGIAAFGVMSPLCVWEMGWHGLHGDFGTAFRRWRKTTTFEGVPIHYPSIRRLTIEFSPYFRRVYVEPLGLWLPPSDAYGMIERRPRLLRTLTALDRQFSRVRQFASFADHCWIEFERLP